MLKQRCPAGCAGRAEVHDVHHRVGRHQSAGAVGAVDEISGDLAVVAEEHAVPGAVGRVAVGRVAHAVGFDELDTGLVPGVADLGGERVAVSHPSTGDEFLAVLETEAAGDVQLSRDFIEVLHVLAADLGVFAVGLHTHTPSDDVHHGIVQDLIVEAIVALGIPALLDHRVAIAGTEVATGVHVRAHVKDLTGVALRHAFPSRVLRIASASAVLSVGLLRRQSGRCLEQFLRSLRDGLSGGLLLRLRGHS